MAKRKRTLLDMHAEERVEVECELREVQYL